MQAAHSSESYEAIATQIARIFWGMCSHEINGRRYFYHANENNLDAPCDMLARLGLLDMQSDVAHCFVSDWSPFTEAPLIRHAGEPSEHDLVLALTFYTHWFPDEAAARHRGLAIVSSYSPDQAYNDPAVVRYRVWAVQGACKLLEQLGLGTWGNHGAFMPHAPYSSDDDIASYWANRSAMIQRLGSEMLLYPPLSENG